MAVSNEGKQVVHKGASHTALGADPCLNGSFENAAPSTNLAAAASTKTLIESHPIALVGTHWDPSNSGGVVGVKSGTTKKEAVVTSGSRNLLIEGRPAARTGDPTTQNHGNAKGSVLPGSLAPSAESLEDRAKKKCKLTSWTATSSGGGKLGYPGLEKQGQPNYLEVKRDETVTFTSKRHDITKTPPAENPRCELGPHTSWSAKGNKFPFFSSVADLKKEGTETFEFPAGLVVETFASAAVMTAVQNGDTATAMNALAGQLLGTKLGKEDESAAGGRVGYSAQQGAYVDGKVEWKTMKGDDGKARAKVVVDIRTMLFFFWWWISAPELKVTATSCAGALDATLKVFPSEPLEFEFQWTKAIKEGNTGKFDREKKSLKDQLADAEKQRDRFADKAARANRSGDAATERGAASTLKAESVSGTSEQANQRRNANRNRADEAFDEAKKQYAKAEAALAKFENAEKTIDSLKEALKNLEKTLSTVKRISDLADVPVKYEIAKGLSLKLALEYLRTEDKPSARGWREYTTAHIGQKWTLTFGCESLIGVSWTARVSLLTLAGPYMASVAQLLRKYRIVNVDLGILLGFNLGATLKVEKLQHDEFSGGGSTTSKFTLSLFMEMGGASVDVAKATIKFPATLTLEFAPPVEKGALLKTTPKFSTTNNYEVILFPDRWWKVKVASGSIDVLRYDWNKNGATYWAVPTVPA
jgi:uncharacterized Zn-binding protein involved in type VI secretion